MQSTEGFTPSAAGNRMTKLGGTNNNCYVQYNQAAANAAPTLTYQGNVSPTTPALETQVNDALRVAC